MVPSFISGLGEALAQVTPGEYVPLTRLTFIVTEATIGSPLACGEY